MRSCAGHESTNATFHVSRNVGATASRCTEEGWLNLSQGHTSGCEMMAKVLRCWIWSASESVTICSGPRERVPPLENGEWYALWGPMGNRGRKPRKTLQRAGADVSDCSNFTRNIIVPGVGLSPAAAGT